MQLRCDAVFMTSSPSSSPRFSLLAVIFRTTLNTITPRRLQQYLQKIPLCSGIRLHLFIFTYCCKVIISLRIVPAASVPLTWLNALCFEIRSRALHLVACQRTVRLCWRIVRLTNILLLFRIVRIQFIKANSLLFRTLVYNTYSPAFAIP